MRGPKLIFGWICTLGWGASTGLGTSLEDAPPVETIVARYVEEMGGAAALQSLESVRFSATMTPAEGQPRELLVIKKRPNKYRLVMSQGAERLVRSFDGEVAWQVLPGQDWSQASEMPPAEAAEFIRAAPLESRLLDPQDLGLRLELRDVVNVVGRPCYQIRVSSPEGDFSDHYVDAEDYVERQIVNYVPGANGEVLEAATYPSDYRSVDGVLFAFRILRRFNDENQTEIRVHDIDVNAGVMDSVFAKPSGRFSLGGD